MKPGNDEAGGNGTSPNLADGLGPLRDSIGGHRNDTPPRH